VTHSAQPNLTKSRLYAAVLAMAAMPLLGGPAMGQYTAGTGPPPAIRQIEGPLQATESAEVYRAVPQPVTCCI
jgi:hypothetical protein